MNDKAEDLRKVASGLGWVYTGFCLMILTIIGGVIGMIVVAGNGNIDQVGNVAGMIGLMSIVAIVIDLIGRLQCLAMPEENSSSARPIVYISVLFSFIAMVVGGAQFIAVFGFDQLLISDQVDNLKSVLALLGSILFIAFLRQLAFSIENEELARRAMGVLTLGFVSVLGIVASTILAFFTGLEGPICLNVPFFVLGFVVVIRYGVLLSNLRTAVRRYADHLAAEF